MKKLTAALFLMTLSTGAFADLVYSISGHQEILLKKVSRTRFEKIAQTNVGEERLERVKNGSSTLISKQELNIADDKSAFALEATGKNILKIEDEKEQINSEVQANITRSILGTIKEVKVDGKTMDSVYADAYKRAGVDVLKGLNLGGVVKSNIQTSDLSCAVDGDLMKCEQDQVLKFIVNGI